MRRSMSTTQSEPVNKKMKRKSTPKNEDQDRPLSPMQQINLILDIEKLADEDQMKITKLDVEVILSKEPIFLSL